MTTGGGEGEGSKGMDWWILATSVDTRILTIPIFNHPNFRHAIDMGTMMAFKIHERREGAVKPGRHGFVPKVGMEESIIYFLKRCVVGKKNTQ